MEKKTTKGVKQGKDTATKNWKTILNHKGWDYGLAIILFLFSCFLFYRLYTISFFSSDKMMIIALFLMIINAIFFGILWIKKMPTWGIWIKRVFILILCILMGYGSFFVSNLQSSLEAMTQPETATTINISLITKKDGGAKLLKDLSGKKIGIQTANDATNSTYVKEQLAKEEDLKNVTHVEGIDYDSLYQKLQAGEIDGLIITNYYFNTLLKDTYPTIEDDIFILKSYQKQKETNMSTSTKDIRYEPFTVYLAGVDEGDDPSIDARSDVNIVLIVNPLANHIEMVSIPRDSFVPNPALNYANDKLTHLGLNGVENSMKGIEEVFGFEIDYYVKLNFFSVIDIIDAIGEIEVDVPISFCEQDENRSFAEEDLICLNEGVQKVNGKQALAFARHRKSYTDIMRGKAQQEVIKGIINVLTTPSGVANINNVLKIATKAISTNMPMDQVTNFVSAQLDHLKPWTIDSITLENGVDGRLVTASMPGLELYVMLLNRSDVQKAFDAYQSMLNQMQMSSYTFDLDNLNEGKEELPYNPKVLWAGEDTSQYQNNEDDNTTAQGEEDGDIPEVTPPVNTDPTPIPPEQPDEPDKVDPNPVPNPVPNPDPNPPVNPDKPVDPEKPDPSPAPNPEVAS